MSTSIFNPDSRTETTGMTVKSLEDGRYIELEVSTTHNKDRKSFDTFVARLTVDGHIRKLAPMDDIQFVDRRPVSRYSAKKLRLVHADFCGLIGDADWQNWAKEVTPR